MKRINNYLNLPLSAQRALDTYWLAYDEMQNNVNCDCNELSRHFKHACEKVTITFKRLNLDVSPFFKPINI
jgi:hypothetical protein